MLALDNARNLADEIQATTKREYGGRTDIANAIALATLYATIAQAEQLKIIADALTHNTQDGPQTIAESP